MKTLSTALLADLIATNRKKLSMTQQSLADATGINRSLISRMEKENLENRTSLVDFFHFFW